MRKPSADSILSPIPAFGDSHTVKCELATEVLRSSGKLRLRVTGSSMLPTIFPGDTLIVERADVSVTQRGDIVLVGRDGRLFAHRLLDTGNDADPAGVLTKGDSMTHSDPPVEHDKVLGRVSFVVRNGEALRPRRKLRLSERAVAALVQRSEIATRFILGVHGLRSPKPERRSQS